MALPNRPRDTAAWLVDHTELMFHQIAEFCDLHPLEVESLANREEGSGVQPRDPIAAGDLTPDEINRCEADEQASLELNEESVASQQSSRSKGPRYTPISLRAEKPNGIAWLLKNHPELSDAAIMRLIGTTRPTIKKIREGEHKDQSQITPKNPVDVGLTRKKDLKEELQTAKKRAS
jgi:hypothetical protein